MTFNNLGDTILGDTTLTITAVGLLGNTLLLSYFLCNRAWRRLSDTLYFLISLVDTVILVFHVPVSISLTSLRQPGTWFSTSTGCGVWGVVWNTAMRLSIFVIMVLAVTRMIILVHPFKRIRKPHILVHIGFYFVLEILQASVPFYIGLEYTYVGSIAMCFWPDYRAFQYPSNGFFIWYFHRAIFEFAAPFIVIISCCIVSVVSLYRSKRSQKYSPQECRVNNKNNATLTIIILASAYIICNIPLLVYSTVSFTDAVIDPHNQAITWDDNNYCFIVFCINSVMLNAAVNPVLFLSRVSAMRVWVRGCLLRGRGLKGSRDCRMGAPCLRAVAPSVDRTLDNFAMTSLTLN
ncbi:hypothetical protein ACHWQZ_G005053 [Mnemiopsis leidyi]